MNENEDKNTLELVYTDYPSIPYSIILNSSDPIAKLAKKYKSKVNWKDIKVPRGEAHYSYSSAEREDDFENYIASGNPYNMINIKFDIPGNLSVNDIYNDLIDLNCLDLIEDGPEDLMDSIGSNTFEINLNGKPVMSLDPWEDEEGGHDIYIRIL